MAYARKKSGSSARNGNGYRSGGRGASQRKSGTARKSSAPKRSTGRVSAAKPQTIRIEIVNGAANEVSRPVGVKVTQPRRAQF